MCFKMEDLEVIIENILKKQSEPIANQLGNLGWLMSEFDMPHRRLPEVSVGYGFIYKNEKLNLKISLECLADDIDEDIM